MAASDMDDDIHRWMKSIMGVNVPSTNLDREVEPKLVGDGPTGQPDAQGRGELTLRQQKRLEALRGFWERGYCD